MLDPRPDDVIPRHIADSDGIRHLEARRLADGTVVIEGQDLGRGVSAVFGDAGSEYEWTRTIRPGDVPMAIRALGGTDGDDLLALLADWAAAHGGLDPSTRLGEAGVPMERWSRIGD
jgi:hypothetical protein